MRQMEFITQSTSGALAVSKPPLLALITNAGSNSTGGSWAAKKVYKANETLVDVLTCRRFWADANGGVDVKIVGGMPQVSLSLWQGVAFELANESVTDGAANYGAGCERDSMSWPG